MRRFKNRTLECLRKFSHHMLPFDVPQGFVKLYEVYQTITDGRFRAHPSPLGVHDLGTSHPPPPPGLRVPHDETVTGDGHHTHANEGEDHAPCWCIRTSDVHALWVTSGGVSCSAHIEGRGRMGVGTLYLHFAKLEKGGVCLFISWCFYGSMTLGYSALISAHQYAVRIRWF